jgi:inner membrane transporter RhtA
MPPASAATAPAPAASAPALVPAAPGAGPAFARRLAGRRPVRMPAALLVLGSCTSLQVGAALAMRLFPIAGATGTTLLRLAIAAAALLAATRPRVRTWTRTQWREVVLYGLSLGAMNGFFYAAISRIPLGAAVTVEFLGPLTLAAVLSRRARDLGWVLLALTGVLVLGWAGRAGAGSGGLDLVGVLFALAAAAMWALYILTGARAGAAVPGRGGLAVAMTVGTLLLLPLGACGAARALARPALVLVAVGTSVAASIVPYTLELAALRRIPRHVFGILLSLEPAVAALAGWLLLSQHLGPLALAGILATVLAGAGSALCAPEPAPDGAGDAASPDAAAGPGEALKATAS